LSIRAQRLTPRRQGAKPQRGASSKTPIENRWKMGHWSLTSSDPAKAPWTLDLVGNFQPSFNAQLPTFNEWGIERSLDIGHSSPQRERQFLNVKFIRLAPG
jgi:hypothetical protein